MEFHDGKIACAPSEAGYNPAAINALDTHIERIIDKEISPAGAYLLARHGKIFAHRSMGKTGFETAPVDFLPDSIRGIASITKIFTATGILQLIEQGKIALMQTVSSIIKEFDTDMHRGITIFQLLTHTSGLKADPGTFLEPYPEEWFEGMTPENWIKKVLSGPLQFKPGTHWNYCSKGFGILAEIITRVSGIIYDEYIVEHVFKPLGMNDSCYYVPEEKKKRVACISEWNIDRVNWKKQDVKIPSMFGGGGIFSTLPDLFKFGQMLLNGGVFNNYRCLGRKTVESAVRPHIKDIKSINWQPRMFDDAFTVTYGLGFQVNKHPFLPEGVFSHEGAEGALLFMDPKENFLFAGFFPSGYSSESWVNPLAIAWSGIE